MIQEGTKILIDGIPYKVISCIPGTLGRYVLGIAHDTDNEVQLKVSIPELIESLQECHDDAAAISEKIINWFIDEKIKSGVNNTQILKIKVSPEKARAQIRKLMRIKYSVEEIVEVLGYSIQDEFWSGVLNMSINTVAEVRKDGMRLYDKIRSQMINRRHVSEDKFHQPTKDELVGVEITE